MKYLSSNRDSNWNCYKKMLHGLSIGQFPISTFIIVLFFHLVMRILHWHDEYPSLFIKSWKKKELNWWFWWIICIQFDFSKSLLKSILGKNMNGRLGIRYIYFICFFIMRIMDTDEYPYKNWQPYTFLTWYLT